MRCFILGLMLALAMPCATAQRSLPVPKPLHNVRRIVVIGDSITRLGSDAGGYVWLIERYLTTLFPHQGFLVINAGVPGHRSSDMEERFQRDVLNLKPDLVVISAGINDVWFRFHTPVNDYLNPNGDGIGGVTAREYRRNMEQMITRAKRKGARVVVMTPTLIKEDLNSPENRQLLIYVQIARELAKQYDTYLADMNRAFREHIRADREQKAAGRAYTSGGIHLNGRGNALMAKTLLHTLGISDSMMARVARRVESVRCGK